MLPRRASLVGLPNWVELQAVLCNHSWSGGALGCAPLSDVVTGWTPCSGRATGGPHNRVVLQAILCNQVVLQAVS